MRTTNHPSISGAGARLAAALARTDLAPGVRDFLNDLDRRGPPMTPRQAAVVERILAAPGRPDFAAVNRAALARLPEVLARLLPGGTVRAGYYRAASVAGGAGQSLKVKLTGAGAGRWQDFATGEHGTDPVSLAAAVSRRPQSDAARALARMLGLEGRRHG